MTFLHRFTIALTLTGLIFASSGHADEGATTSVVAEGVGATAEDALKDAFRNAVRQVVGAVVDAETLVKNDKIISDKVLTYSDGFIKKYEEISKAQENGLFRIKINATVERRNVVAKFKEAKVNVKDVDGQGLFAEAVTQEEARKDATALLTKALSGLPTLLTAEAASKPEYDEMAKEVVFDVRIQVDRNAYTAYQKNMEDLLKKISLGQASVTVRGEPHKQLPNCYWSHARDTSVLYGPKLDGKAANRWCIWLSSFNDKAHTTTKWKSYIVDADLKHTVRSIMGNYIIKVALLDSEGQPVIETQCKFPIDEKVYGPHWQPGGKNRDMPFLSHVVVRKKDGSEFGSGIVEKQLVNALEGEAFKDWSVNLYICPYSFVVTSGLRTSGCEFFYQPELIVKQRLKVSLDELKRSKKVECRVTSDKQKLAALLGYTR